MLVDEFGVKKFNIMVYMNDVNYDNDDNKYGKFIYHVYTNMDGPDDIIGKGKSNFNDYTVPLELCNTEELDWRSSSINYYCPKYDETHFLHGGFSASKYNWHRIIVHLCDNSEKAKQERIDQNKKFIECATREDSLTYFENTIIGLESLSNEASIKEEFSMTLYDRERQGENKTQ